MPNQLANHVITGWQQVLDIFKEKMDLGSGVRFERVRENPKNKVLKGFCSLGLGVPPKAIGGQVKNNIVLFTIRIYNNLSVYRLHIRLHKLKELPIFKLAMAMAPSQHRSRLGLEYVS